MDEKLIPNPSPIKPEYENLPWDEFVPMDSVLPPEFSGILMMSKNLDILDTRTKKITKVENYRHNYNNYQVYSVGYLDYTYSFTIHKKGANLFLINDDPNNKIYVDHCNRIPTDCRLTNFRHATPKENAENSTPRIKNNDRYFLRKYDINMNFIEDIPYSKTTQKFRDAVFTGMRRWGKYKNHIYEKKDRYVEDYIEKFGPPVDRDWDPDYPELGGWTVHWEFPTEIKRINSNGFYEDKFGNLLVGNYDEAGYLYTNSINGTNKRISRLILGGFLHIPYDELDKVDHTDTIRNHNSIFNLKNGTHKENMNNPLTRLHLSVPVSRIDMHTFEVKHYNSQIEAEKENELYVTGGLGKCCNGELMTMGGYIWSWKNEEEKRIDKFLKDIENPNKNMPPGYWNLDTLKYWVNRLGCTKRIHFHDKCEGGYVFALENNLIDELFPNKLQKYPRGWWNNLDHVLEAAKECKNKKELQHKYPGAYRSANVHNWKDKLIFKN